MPVKPTLTELDSLVSSHVYEIIRNLYNNPGPETAEEGNRVSVLQQTLSQLRLTNIATLDACMNHFTRLIELTSADDEYVSSLATAMAPCVMRPRVETSLTMEEKHAFRLLKDLFTHKTAIFSELKRMSTQSLSAPVASSKDSQRPRSISTNESNRRQYQEERQRLLLEKAGGGRSRATSPAPSPRGPGSSHRRDRSVGRFPVSAGGVTSPTEKTDRSRASMGPVLPLKRSSLEVPGEAGTPTQATAPDSMNGSDTTDSPNSTRSRSETVKSTDSAEKRNSLSRNSARMSMSLGRRIPVNPTPAAEPTDEHRGVTLEDKPMDD